MLEGLRQGLGIGQAARAAGFPPSGQKIYVLLKVYHPEWPWPGPKYWLRSAFAAKRHQCDEHCERAKAALALSPVLAVADRAAGWRPGRIYDPRVRHQHPQWNWPAR